MSKNLRTFIINSTIPENLTNKSISDGQPILTIDNSLRDEYVSYGFDDYTTIKSSLPPTGGSISPCCNHILTLMNTSESALSQGKWKQISIKHYIYTMDKYLP